jgi:hypothetical protein
MKNKLVYKKNHCVGVGWEGRWTQCFTAKLNDNSGFKRYERALMASNLVFSIAKITLFYQ